MLSPDEIRSRTFLTSLRGYDREDVGAFLQAVADEMEALQQRLDAATAGETPDAVADLAEAGEAGPTDAPDEDEPDPAALEPAPAAAEAGPFAEIGQETQRILEAAQAAGEELRRRARTEADRELEAARTQATRLIAEAERHRDDIAAAVQALEEARDELAGDLREVARSLERMLRELTPAEQVTTPMRAALAEAVRDDEPNLPDPAVVDEDAPAEPPPEALDLGDVPPVETELVAVPDPAPALEVVPQPEPEPAAVGAARTAPERDADAEHQPELRPVARTARGVPERVPVQARGDALAPSHPKLVRRLKRGLQDIQNLTLDRLRRASGKADSRAFLPDETAVSELAQLARQHIANAYAVGYHSGASAIGRAGDDPPELERDLSGALAAEVVRALADQLLEQLEAGTDGEPQVVAERVDRAFAAIRDGLVSQASAMALVRAYEWGQHDAWNALGVTQRKWALALEPPCGDPRCEDNAGSGAVPLGEPFPSGHEVPPARAGCSCTTVPLVPRQ